MRMGEWSAYIVCNDQMHFGAGRSAYFAKYMTVGQTANNPTTIRAAWYAAARKAYAGEGYSAPITFAVAGDDSCQNDSLQNSSTPSGTPYYDSNQVYP